LFGINLVPVEWGRGGYTAIYEENVDLVYFNLFNFDDFRNGV
jgi:hypothetical protein